MKTFTMYRRNVPAETHDENQRNAPDQPQFEGVVFSDGSVAIRWLTAKRSTAVWASMADMLAIHGHPEYGSELVWHAATAELEEERGRLRKALEDICIYGCGMLNQPIALNGPEEDWLRKRIEKYEQVARSALTKKDPSNG